MNDAATQMRGMHKTLVHVTAIGYSNDTHNATEIEMTYADLYIILTEAEQRAADTSLPDDVRARSQETVDICLLRMQNDQISREELKQFASAA